MWNWCCRGKEKAGQQQHQHQHRQTLLILRNDDDRHPPTPTITSAAMILSSWLRTRRRRYLFLALCSPLLLPFLCASFPLLCAIEICLRRRFKTRPPYDNVHDRGSEGMRRCEEGVGGEGEGNEVRLLHRYLEDQLLLVVGSVYDCGDDDDCGLDEGDGVEFLGSSRSSLLPC